ncbi:hypothetical protein P5E37_05685 [Vibrio parahaemolyticus]|nr:hypothetical protein [Vibrio parahaemolyticus]
MNKLTKKQEDIVDIINGRTCIGTYEIEVLYPDQSDTPMSIIVSEEEEDLEDEDAQESIYYDMPVRKAVESCISGEETEHGFIILGVEGYSRDDLIQS